MLQCLLSRALQSFSFHICFIKAYVCQQDCQSNNFPSWQDRCQVKLRSSLIEAMAERYMESPESPACFTVGACSTNKTATAPNLVLEADANSASHPILCARTIYIQAHPVLTWIWIISWTTVKTPISLRSANYRDSDIRVSNDHSLSHVCQSWLWILANLAKWSEMHDRHWFDTWDEFEELQIATWGPRACVQLYCTGAIGPLPEKNNKNERKRLCCFAQAVLFSQNKNPPRLERNCHRHSMWRLITFYG